jgi:hypothetical protein
VGQGQPADLARQGGLRRQVIATAPGKDKLVETHVDLAKALRGGRGHVLAMVEPFPWKERYDPPR